MGMKVEIRGVIELGKERREKGKERERKGLERERNNAVYARLPK